MIDATIYDARGAVIMLGSYADERLAALNSPEGGGYILGHVDPEAVYIVGGVALPRPVRPSLCHAWDWDTLSWVDSDAATAVVWSSLRAERNRRIEDVEWRIRRSDAERELGLSPSEDRVALQTYIQALRDLPENTTDPTAPEWPTPPEENA